MKYLRCAILLLCLIWPVFGQAQTIPASAHGIAPPPHRPPAGTLRIWGHPQASAWLSQQTRRFQRRYPSIRIQTNLTGSDIGMAGLYTGQADIVLMGREATESEIKAFEWVYRYRPTAVPIMTGSLDSPGQAPALVVFVHRDNPLSALSLAQLDGMFGTAREHGWEHDTPVLSGARGRERDIRLWGQLGLLGEWAHTPIRIYMPMSESGSGRFFRQQVLAGSHRLYWDGITEFADPVNAAEDSAARILAALARDRTGIALANLHHPPPEVRAIALSAGGEHPVLPSAATVAAHRYPLVRTVYAYINQPPDEALDWQVSAWFEDILSAKAQRAARRGGYLPLPPPQIRQQRARFSDH